MPNDDELRCVDCEKYLLEVMFNFCDECREPVCGGCITIMEYEGEYYYFCENHADQHVILANQFGDLEDVTIVQ